MTSIIFADTALRLQAYVAPAAEIMSVQSGKRSYDVMGNSRARALPVPPYRVL